MMDDRVIIEVFTDMSALSQMRHARRMDTLKRGADMGIKLIKSAVVARGSIVVVLDRSGKFEQLETLEECQRVFAGSRLHKSDD
jgi:hypothetical protein